MAVDIQEPNDLPPNAITDDNANRYEILVYEQSQDVAGIKRLAIAGWKDYLGFNSHKVNNVAHYLGMPSDYAWETDADVPYEGTTVTDQVDTLATKLGISQEPGTFDPLYPRFQTVENEVNGTGSPAAGGLIQRMAQAETDIQSIEEEIGSSGGGSGSLTARITTLENKVGNEASGSDPATGLINDVRNLQTTVGDSASGLVKDVSDNTSNITTLQTTVGDSTSGLVKDVTTLQSVVGDDNSGLVKKVNDLESKVYFYKGNITDVTNSGDTTTAITVDGTTITVSVDNLKNGWVYNINPSASGVDSLIINGEKYNRGENVAIINDGSTVKFDKLGANIDVEEVEEIKEKVDAMSMVVFIPSGGSWNSSNLKSGIYQFSCFMQGLSSETVTFILSIDDSGTAQGQTIDLSNNFTTYFEIPASGYLTMKSSVITRDRKLSIHKIGEI